jgi:two-component system, NtrC family, nitrogen regulation response regulator NtrX
MLSSVLIIDDDPEMRKMLTEVLGDEGYSVESASNGKDALKSCEKLPFDVALVDIELPDIKGTELLTKLKLKQPKMVNIIITGHPSVENAMKAVNEKADGYVLKPFEIPALLATMKRLVDEKTNAYFAMFTEVEKAKEKTPLFKYSHPDKW